MVATADEDDPDIAPKRAEEMIVTMPNPPWNRPTTALAKDTIFEEIPAAVITPPAKMKNGMAIRIKEFSPEKMAGTTNPECISRKKIMARLPRPKQTNKGNPDNKSRIVNPVSISSNVKYLPPW
jgi:hypothetical protein